MKKITLLLMVTLLSLSVSGCEMDPAMMEMIMSFMGGLSGYSGGSFNMQGEGGGSQSWAMAGSTLRNMWMSQSENSQDGRDMSGMLQANQIALDYSQRSSAPVNTSSNQGIGGGTDSNSPSNESSGSDEDKSWWQKGLDKGAEKLQDMDADDWTKVLGYVDKFSK